MSDLLRFAPALIVLVCLTVYAVETDEHHLQAQKNAVEVAQAWLALVDQSEYAKTWESAAKYLRDAVDREAFVKSLRAAREPLGEMQTRSLKSKQYRTTLPGAPDGQYVVIQFEASFKDKKSAIETITPMLDADGTWRVSGYFIK